MKLKIGDKVCYPSQGPCLVGAVVKRVVEGKLTEFRQLTVLDQGGGELLVPMDKAQAKGIRKLLQKSEIPGLLSRLNKMSASDEKWPQRSRDNSLLFTSGSVYDLAAIIGSMSELRETKRFQASDRQTLERAKRMLACEISEVTGETRIAAEEQIDRILDGRKGIKEPKTKTARRWPEVENYGEAL